MRLINLVLSIFLVVMIYKISEQQRNMISELLEDDVVIHYSAIRLFEEKHKNQILKGEIEFLNNQIQAGITLSKIESDIAANEIDYQKTLAKRYRQILNAWDACYPKGIECEK